MAGAVGSDCQHFGVRALQCYRCLWKGESFALWKWFLSARKKAIWGWYKDSTPAKRICGKLQWEETAGQKKMLIENIPERGEMGRRTCHSFRWKMQFISIMIFGIFSFSPPPFPPPPKSAKGNWFLIQKHDSVLPQLGEDFGILMQYENSCN